jgi:hypothetical protein
MLAFSASPVSCNSSMNNEQHMLHGGCVALSICSLLGSTSRPSIVMLAFSASPVGNRIE